MKKGINKVAVIGAGTMGASIAALVANAGIPACLLDITPQELTDKEKDKGLTLEHPAVRNRIVNEGWTRCMKGRPATLFSKDAADRVALGNLEDNLDMLADADWILEVIIERLDIKQDLMAKIEAVRKPDSIVATNTSGISIEAIAEGRSEEFKAHFLGTHFFNPPRYLKLLEIIPHPDTDPVVLETMKEFGSKTLGKGVVFCKDTPNFITNRFLGIASIYTMNYALDHGYSVEEVDALTGPVVGYPKSATFRLFDLVGNDVMAMVMSNLHKAIPHDLNREVLIHEKGLALVNGMVERKWLGNKTKGGFYKQVTTEKCKQYWVLNPEAMEHQAPEKPKFESVEANMGISNVGERIKKLCSENDRAGQFIWATRAFGCNYAASIVPEASDDILSIDNACKWGLGYEIGPFETWDALGVAEAVERMESEGVEVTPWVKEMLAAGHTSFYNQENGKLFCYSPISKDYIVAESDPYFFPLAEMKNEEGRVIAANTGASLVDMGDGVLGLEFHTKANSLNQSILEMLGQAREELEEGDWVGLVVGNQGKHFCAGADLTMFLDIAKRKAWDEMENILSGMQHTLLAFRHSPKPVVSAPFGMVLGGGAEVMMGSSAICAAGEAYIGQTEAGVGVIPAAGGCTELLRRVLAPVIKNNPNADMMPYLQRVFEMIAMGKVSSGGEEAQEWGFLTSSDRVVMNADHLLHEAKKTVLQMVDSGYRPPVRGKNVYILGAEGLAALKMVVWSFEQAGYLSEHDTLIADKTAYILAGGELSRPQWVEPEYIFELERQAFLSLLGEPKTIERIEHMLKTKRVLRN
jgi:3-hydroxyacyl-CoA dehydrogenase